VGLLHNYLNNATTIGETSGTALLAAVAYRMAVLEPTVFSSAYIAWADTSLNAVAKHVNAAGVVAPAVDPYDYRSQTPYTKGSPEGQAFTVMLYAAHRDCVAASVCSS
jgi:hypothetical protein